MAKIFLSYASESHSIADEINLSLLSRGHDVFFDRDDLPDGEKFELQIEEGLKRSDFMIFLISPNSIQKGRFTRTELKYARAKWPNPDGRLLPVMVEPTPIADVPAYLKVVGIMEPSGSVSAEVATAIDDMVRNARQAGRGRRIALMAGAAILVLTGAIALNMDQVRMMMSGASSEAAVVAQSSDTECSGDAVYTAILTGEMSYDQAKAVGGACANVLIQGGSNGRPGADPRTVFAEDFAIAATSSDEGERRAVAALIQGNTGRAIESFFALARAATTPITKARHFRSAAALSFTIQPDLAIEALEEVVALEPDDLNALWGLGALYRTIGDAENAERIALEMQSKAGQGGLDWQASAKLEESRRQFSMGNFEQAKADMLTARGLFEQTGNRWGTATSLIVEADLLISRGSALDAREILDDALVLAETYQFPDVEAQAKTAKGRTYMMMQDNDQASALFEDAQQSYERLNNAYSVAYVLNQRGFVAMNQAEPGEARDLFAQSRDKMSALGDLSGTAWADYNIGNAEIALSNFQAAENAYTTAQQTFSEIGLPNGEVACIIALAGLRSLQGRQEQALDLYMQAKERAEQSGLLSDAAQALFGAAYIHRSSGDLARSETTYLEALDLFERGGHLMGTVFTLEALGQVAMINGAEEDAKAYWQHGLELSQATGLSDVAQRIEYELSQLD